MATNDLSECNERLDYCETELRAIERAIATYSQSAVETRWIAASPHKALQLRITKPFPVAIKSRVGTTIHEIRATLDALACALAVRNANQPGGVYFPISKTEEIFGIDGMKKIKKLSVEHQAKIVALRPYGGGNKLLFGMHEFDRVRKHQRLTQSFPGFRGLGFNSSAKIHMIEMRGARLTDEWQTVATFSQDSVFQANLKLPVRFLEPTELENLGVEEGIASFLAEARAIVAMFA